MAENATQAPVDMSYTSDDVAVNATLGPVDMPYTSDDDIANGVDCFMCVGEKYQGKSWHALYLHLLRKHSDIKPGQLVGSYLHKKARAEKNASQKKHYSIGRIASDRTTSPVYEDEVVSNTQSLQDDVETASPESSSEVTAGAVVKDATWQPRNCLVFCDHTGVPLQPLQCRLESLHDQFVAKSSWDRRRRGTSLLLEKLDSIVHPKCKVAIPNLAIRTKFVEWRTTPEAEAKLRKRVPIPVDKAEFPLPAFEAYVGAFGFSDSDHIFLAVRRFLNMLEIEGDIIESDLIGVQVGAYQQGVLSQLLSLPIMQPKYSWAQKIVKGLGWLIEHLTIRCGQERLVEEKRILELIEPEIFAPYDRRVAKAQHAAACAKNSFDQRLLEDFAHVDVVKRIVYEAMLDLGALGVVTKGKTDLTPSERHAATTSFVMILYGNGFAGRSGDWEKLTACAARRFLQEGRNYIECVEHKTAGHYGEVGKGLFEGTIAAAWEYLGLPGKKSHLLLEPNREGTKAAVASALRTGSKIYCPGVTRWKSNLIRKLYHSEYLRQSRTSEILKVLKEVDKHSESVALNRYCCQSPRRDAEFGLCLYRGIFGEPVAWPSQEEVLVRAGSIQQLLNTHQALEDADYANEQLVPYESPSDEEDFVDRCFALGDAPCHGKRRRAVFENDPETQHNASKGSLARKTPAYLDDCQKAWLFSKRDEDVQQDAGTKATVPSKPWLRKVLEEGIQDGILTCDNSLEGVRSLFARAAKDIAPACVDECIKNTHSKAPPSDLRPIRKAPLRSN